MKLLTFSPLLLAGTSLFTSAHVQAQDYQSFSSVEFRKYDSEYIENNSYWLNTRYFLDKKSALGPLDQYEYINKTSNVSANYFNGEYSNDYRVGGEFFMDQWLVGGSYRHQDYERGDDEDFFNLDLGYLLSDNFLIKAQAYQHHSDTDYLFSASYNHQLNDSDYLGFTYSSDDDFDTQTLSSKYFRALGQGSYLTANISYIYNDNRDNDLSGEIKYYFNTFTSVGASFNDDEDYSFSASHYFNKNYALSAKYQSNTEDHIDYDLYTVNFTAQF